jgi:NhaA family Na+:H+ antiporter
MLPRTRGNLFREFFKSEKSSGFILIGCTVLSLLLANSPIGEGYTHFLHKHINLSFAGLKLDYSIEHWINDGLMSIFFLLVGLEIERELYVGELASIQKALLPIIAAVGGMVVPAGIHFLFNSGTPQQAGFGIPMATDIAFTLGILSLAGKRVPISLKIFLTALAIIDDLGAIAVIALFYSKGFSIMYFGLALGVFGLLYVLGRKNVNALWIYIVGGVIMWYCMMQSGVHATIAGVLLAFAIPFPRTVRLEDNPSWQLQHFLHYPVAFVILPLFALANTAIPIAADAISGFKTNNALGIMAGLFIGKPLGILLFCFVAVKSGLAKMAEGILWKALAGAAVLAGIGFTMSIFITNLAFNDQDTIDQSKLAILAASLISALGGLLILFQLPLNKRAHRRPHQE